MFLRFFLIAIFIYIVVNPTNSIVHATEFIPQSTLEWLSNELKDLKQELQQSEVALAKATATNKNYSKTLDNKKINDLNDKLLSLNLKNNRIKEIKKLFNKARVGDGFLAAVPELFTSPVFESLKDTEIKLLQKQARYSQRYGHNHPKMVEFKAEYKAFENALSNEIEIFDESLSNQIIVQNAQIDNLKQRLKTLNDLYDKNAKHQINMQSLNDKVNNLRQTLNDFASTYIELENIQSHYKLNEDGLISISDTDTALPLNKNTNQEFIYLSLIQWGALMSLVLWVLIFILYRKINGYLRSPKQIEKLLNLPIYACLPKIKLEKGETHAQYILNTSSSYLAETMRSLLVTLKLRDPHTKSGGRVVTITSTNPGEGKTATAIWLATTAVQNGQNVLVIDTNMRDPSLHKNYNIGNARGIVDYLSDRLPLDDTIYKKHPSGVHLMTSKAVPTYALTLLNSERMETLVRRVSDMYDLVVLDCSAAYIYADARLMSSLSDKTLYMVVFNKVKSDILKNTIHSFQANSKTSIAIIMNKVKNVIK